MSLSDKIMYQMGDEELDDDNMVFHKDDVKKSIQELRERIMCSCLGCEECADRDKIVEEIFGDKLTSTVQIAKDPKDQEESHGR